MILFELVLLEMFRDFLVGSKEDNRSILFLEINLEQLIIVDLNQFKLELF